MMLSLITRDSLHQFYFYLKAKKNNRMVQIFKDTILFMADVDLCPSKPEDFNQGWFCF